MLTARVLVQHRNYQNVRLDSIPGLSSFLFPVFLYQAWRQATVIMAWPPFFIQVASVVPVISGVPVINAVIKIHAGHAHDDISTNAGIINKVMTLMSVAVTVRRGMRRRTVTAILSVYGISRTAREQHEPAKQADFYYRVSQMLHLIGSSKGRLVSQ